MVRCNRFWEGSKLNRLWILFLVFSVTSGRRYDKCLTRDNRQGVCVLKRYCREATHHELLHCERDEENHCCPIQPTQRSAPTPPPHQEDKYRFEPEVREKRPDVYREPPREERVRRPPPPEDRRPPVRYDDEKPKRQPIHEKRDEYDDRPQRQPMHEKRDEYDDRPQRQPIHEKRDDDDRRTVRPHRRPEVAVPDRPREDTYNRPPPRPSEHDRRDPPRRPDPDRNYPAKEDDRETGRKPNRRTHNERSKNRTADETSKAPIKFPETYELSVPRPKVPACGVKPYELFIAGGQESGDHEWPWMTAIFRRFPDSRPKTFLCGGSLINTKYVLTAAHCFVNNYVILPASSFVVRLGSHFLDSGEEYTVANLVIHHNHSGSDFFNDIALVRLASEVYVTDKIAPICLPYPEMMRDNLVGKLATVAGWGDTAFRTSGTRILQHVTVPIVSGEECFAAYSRVRGAAFLARGSDHVICAGLREGGKDACLGDSGGPLMMRLPDDRWIVIGIVSLGYKCAEPGYPGVYTRVTHYMTWINTNMKKY